MIPAAAGAGVTLLVTQGIKLLQRKKASESIEERSTTSASGGGVAAYETNKAVSEYLQFHFGRDEDILPYSIGPTVRRRTPLHAPVGSSQPPVEECQPMHRRHER